MRWVDDLLEQALVSFQRAGLLRDTLVVVTSDPGEAFGEHGMLLHGRTLHDERLRVPPVLLGPPPFDRGRVLDASVSLLDVFPTVERSGGAEEGDQPGCGAPGLEISSCASARGTS